MRSVKLISKKRASRKDGTAPVYIQYSYNRDKRILLNTQKYIAQKDWNSDLGKVRRRHPESERINEYCERLKQRVESIVDKALLDQIDPTPEYVKERFEGKVILQAPEKTEDFWHYWDKFIDSSHGRVQNYAIVQYGGLARHLREFEKCYSYPITFDSVDYSCNCIKRAN